MRDPVGHHRADERALLDLVLREPEAVPRRSQAPASRSPRRVVSVESRKSGTSHAGAHCLRLEAHDACAGALLRFSTCDRLDISPQQRDAAPAHSAVIVGLQDCRIAERAPDRGSSPEPKLIACDVHDLGRSCMLLTRLLPTERFRPPARRVSTPRPYFDRRTVQAKARIRRLLRARFLTWQ